MGESSMEFTGSLKSFVEVCEMIGLDYQKNFFRWEQRPEGHRMLLPTHEGDTYLYRGDVITYQYGKSTIDASNRKVDYKESDFT